MIIVRKGDTSVAIPCGLGPVVCPDIDHNLQMKQVDPSTSTVTVEPSIGFYGLYRVIVNPISSALEPDLLASNIRRGVEIFGVEGIFDGGPLEGKTVNPSTAEQTVTPDEDYYGLSHVTVNPVTAAIDPDLVAGNIKKDVEILGVVGTFEGGALQSKTVNSSTTSQTVTPDGTNYGLSSVTVNPYTLKNKIVNSSTQQQTITADNADGLSQVTVNPYALDSKTVNPSVNSQVVTSDEDGLSSVTVNAVTASIDPDIQAGNIKKDVEILGVVGTYEGTVINNQNKTVNSSTTSQTITSDSGYTGLGTVTVNPYTLDAKTVNPSTNSITVNSSADGMSSVTVNAVTASIDPDIQAANIKEGVEILGVAGTFQGGPLQNKTVDSSTSSQTISADSPNYGLGQVTVNPYTLETKTQNITQNGTYTVTPSNADGLSSVDISVNVADIPAVLQTKSVSYNQNGEYQVEPDQGYEGISHIDISVNVPDVPPELQSKTVDSSTSSQTVTADPNYDGLSSVTVNAALLENRTVDPSTVQIDVTSSSADYYGLKHVYVNAVTAAIDPDIQAGNIREGVEILGVVGTYEGTAINNQNKTVSSSTSSQTVTADSGYTGLGTVTVNPYTLDAKTVNPSTNSITVNSSADGMSSVTVNAVTASIDPDIQASNIKKDVEILGVVGTYEGASINNQNKTVDPSTSRQIITADSGYTGLGTVTVNPVNAVSGSETITQNGTYGFDGTWFDGDYIDYLEIDVSVDSQAINNQNKTVNSSTSSQAVTADSGYTGLGTVTVNPYTLDSKTVDPSTSQITVNSSADGLSSVTVKAVTAAIDPNISAGNIRRGVNILGVIGTYDSSSNSNWIIDTKKGVITDLVTDTEGLNARNSGLYGLFCNTPTLNSVTFTNSSVSSYAFEEVCRSCNNLTSVSVPNITTTGDAGFNTAFDQCDKLSHIDFPELTTVQEGGFVQAFAHSCTSTNVVDASVTFPKLAYIGVSGMYLSFHDSGFTSVYFPVLTAVAREGFSAAFGGSNDSSCVQDVSFPNLSVCDYAGDSYLKGSFYRAFAGNHNITSLSFPSLTTGTQSTFDYAFIECTNLASISIPAFTSSLSPSSICDCSSLVSITAHPLAIGTTWLSDSSYMSPYNDSFLTNTNSSLTTVTLTQDASDNISFSGCSALSAATVLNILEHLDLTVSGKTCTFYSGILSIDDDEQGTIQAACNAATTAGWTISNLVIHGASYRFIDYIESTGQTLVLGNNMDSSYFVEATVQPVYGGSSVSEYNRFIAVEVGAANTSNEWRFAVKSATNPDQSVDSAWYADLAVMDPTIKSKILLGCRNDGYFWFVLNNVSNTYYRYNRPYNGSGEFNLCFSCPNNYGKTWGIKIYDNLTTLNYDASTMTTSETPLYSYVPAQRIYDNAYGLYEEISGEFYTVAGLTGGMDQE